jgi:hypothetical protein
MCRETYKPLRTWIFAFNVVRMYAHGGVDIGIRFGQFQNFRECFKAY